MQPGFRQVGEIPPVNTRKPIIRPHFSPLDKCTIVSIYPKEVVEIKHTIEPGKFVIPAGRFESPSILIVGPSTWWSEQPDTRPDIAVPVASNRVAHSVIMDSCAHLVEANPDRMPGLFFIDGEHDIETIQSKYKSKLLEVKLKQNRWYNRLIDVADSLWARSNGNPLTIADEMKLAAVELGYIDKPWLRSHQAPEMIRCFACGTLKSGNFPVCPACRAVDSSHPAAKDLKFAQ